MQKFTKISLHKAASNNDMAQVKMLLDHGIDPTSPRLRRDTNHALAPAERRRIDVNVRDKKNRTALHFASERGFTELVTLLLTRGADVNATDIIDGGFTPLQLAAWYGYTEVVALLLERGADVNAKTKGWWTALLFASHSGRSKEIIALLLAYGAFINEKNSLGWTALRLASSYGHKEIVALLIAHGAEVNIVSGSGTALHEAAYEGHKEIVALLLAHGADVNMRDRDGKTAVILAQEQGHQEIVKLFELNRNAVLK